MNIQEKSTRLTEQELVNYWKISVHTLRKWRSTGYGPIYIKVGGRILYRREDVEEFEKNNLYQSSSQKINLNKMD
ncbi:MAG: helix-turn-helix domain-containing protein [Alphaproteobacteria bacterium]